MVTAAAPDPTAAAPDPTAAVPDPTAAVPDPTAAAAPDPAALLRWGEARRRDLPWRRTRDPWAILVSELMLQQTQVARVMDRWPVFLERFPSPASCAAAPVGEVVQAWAGLGYNRRAVSLHRCAVRIVDDHGGQVPADLDQLRGLPGIGQYTARAVLAFAFEKDHGVLDTNAGRVLARAWTGRRLSAVEAQRLADAVVPAGRGWAWNQAMLDLGATVCTRRTPRCKDCPIVQACAWARTGCRTADPSERSAGTSSRQSTFGGSDRQGRGRLVEALRAGPVAPDDLPAAMGWPNDPARAMRVAATLVADGLAVLDPDGIYALPG